jgi:uncharacterized protein (DUF2236 family)
VDAKGGAELGSLRPSPPSLVIEEPGGARPAVVQRIGDGSSSHSSRVHCQADPLAGECGCLPRGIADPHQAPPDQRIGRPGERHDAPMDLDRARTGERVSEMGIVRSKAPKQFRGPDARGRQRDTDTDPNPTLAAGERPRVPIRSDLPAQEQDGLVLVVGGGLDLLFQAEAVHPRDHWYPESAARCRRESRCVDDDPGRHMPRSSCRLTEKNPGGPTVGVRHSPNGCPGSNRGAGLAAARGEMAIGPSHVEDACPGISMFEGGGRSGGHQPDPLEGMAQARGYPVADHVLDPRSAAGANTLGDLAILLNNQNVRARFADRPGCGEAGRTGTDNNDVEPLALQPARRSLVPQLHLLSRLILGPRMARSERGTSASQARRPARTAAVMQRGSARPGTLSVPPLSPGRAGDPGLFGPSSMVWRVHRERVLLLSAPAVVLMQLAHPLIAAAVAQHTNRARTPLERAGDTIGLNLAVMFGDINQSEGAASKVRELHTRVRGRMPEDAGRFAAGSPYRADDPELLRWGHASIVWAGVQAHQRFVGSMNATERDRYVSEARPFGAAFGAEEASLPSTYGELTTYIASVAESALALAPIAERDTNEVLWPRETWRERAAGPAQRIITTGLLPGAVRRTLGLPWGTLHRTAFLALAWAIRLAVRAMPGRLRWWPHYRTACERVGGC